MTDVPLLSPSYYSFDRVAREYETTRILPEIIAESLAVRLCAGISTSDWVLDAGVGTGRIGRAIARQHRRAVGVDISPGMLARLQSVRPRPHLALADLRGLPFATDTFARVLSVHVFHLIPEWKRALAELWRVTRPGGSLFLGFEDRERTEIREFYLERAAERGMLPPRIGAHSAQLLEQLAEWGAGVSAGYPEELHWSYSVSATETLAMLERRTYSSLWDVPESEHRRLIDETRTWVLQEFGTLEYRETVRVRLFLGTATKR
jgi:ubiquinone/menaquinone biosynthesis C-methylase UbiE